MSLSITTLYNNRNHGSRISGLRRIKTEKTKKKRKTNYFAFNLENIFSFRIYDGRYIKKKKKLTKKKRIIILRNSFD